MSPEFRLRPSLSAPWRGVPRPPFEIVSPEFRLRPSLSAPHGDRRRRRHGGVAGVQTPAFVERGKAKVVGALSMKRVAGVQTPAFVERSRRILPPSPPRLVSPEFRLRPSLSGNVSVGLRRACTRGVAGVQTPAFVERGRAANSAGASSPVSPEFRLRPSLSGVPERNLWVPRARHARGVAGVQTPAFVERVSGNSIDPLRRRRQGVAGVQTPAFVERAASANPMIAARGVAGVQTPAFVERPSVTGAGERPGACRRSSDSGLR